MVIWHLKKGSERKFRFGHPWVFSSELAQSPKGIEPGELVELRDYQGGFLARGYGHPNLMISFRTLALDSHVEIDAAFFYDKLAAAARLREISGIDRESHRLCFAEGDRLPGLVIDRYRLANPGGQVFVVQSSTAGMDRQLTHVFHALERLARDEHQSDSTRPTWDQSSIIVANDAKSRAMEGIAIEPKSVMRVASGFDAKHAQLVVQAGKPEAEPLLFHADLVGGQKTGFFLDQRFNIQLATRFVSKLAQEKRELKVLDLCCYIGQWGAQLSRAITDAGAQARVTLVDASASALELAAKNVEHSGGIAEPMKVDVLDAVARFAPRMYDVVICDPPAFIKKKKDLPTGTQAYFKLNREALRKTAGSGLYVSCSCSGLLIEDEFRGMLAKAGQSSGASVSWLARGGHSADHPQRPEFPQGTYLKSWMGIVT